MLKTTHFEPALFVSGISYYDNTNNTHTKMQNNAEFNI